MLGRILAVTLVIGGAMTSNAALAQSDVVAGAVAGALAGAAIAAGAVVPYEQREPLTNTSCARTGLPTYTRTKSPSAGSCRRGPTESLSGSRGIRRARASLCDRERSRGDLPSRDAPRHPRLRLIAAWKPPPPSKSPGTRCFRAVSILAVGTARRPAGAENRIPDVAVFLVAGIAIGPHALGLIDIKADSALNQIILLFGASYILFDGGAALRLDVLKQVWITILVIATVGVLITAGITGLAAHYILGIPASMALLLGFGARLDRSGDAGADFSASPYSRPGGANRDERVGVQRRHGARSSPSACWRWRREAVSFRLPRLCSIS